MLRQRMTVSPDVFSEMKEKQLDLYDFICVDHDMAFRGWLREKFGINPASPTEFVVVVDYKKPLNYWSFDLLPVR